MPPARQPIADRLVARLSEDEAGCWIWTGSKRNRTYGSIGRGGRGGGSVYTHRLAYELWVGPVPAGADIDHLCRVPACCNPDHLEAVSRSVNLRRGIRRGATPGHRVTDEGRANMRLAAQRRVLTPAGRAQILAAGFRDRGADVRGDRRPAMSPDGDRQIRLIILALNEMRPGIACMDTACPNAMVSGMPHMASDGGNHPHPYGVISSKTHVWRRRRWWMR